MAQPRPLEGPHRRTAQRHTVARLLFKADRPRTIDRYIDYFGGATPTAADDLGGAALLEALTGVTTP
jgi:hypothetical protein